MLAFPCPTCDYRLLAHPGKAGKALVCPRCKASALVPATEPGTSVFEEDPPKLHDSSSVLAGLEGKAGGSTTAAPPRRSARSTTPPPAPARPAATIRGKDAVAFDLPPMPKNSEDVFVQLTTALTMRMNPPPDPPADLRLSTGVWILATAIGFGLWVLSLFDYPELLKFVWIVAGFELAVGLIWVVHRAGRRDTVKGLLTLLPPVTLFRLTCHGGPDGYRPLRFVLTGLLLGTLPLIAKPTRDVLHPAIGWTESGGPPAPPVETPAGKLKQIIERSPNPELIQRELARLAAEDPDEATDSERTDLVRVFRVLLKHDSSDVRGEAVRTLYAWDGSNARPDVTAMLVSEFRDDRSAALALLKNWPDAVAVKAAIGRLASEEDRFAAKDTLVDMGKTHAAVVEKALLDSLANPAPTDPVPAKPLLEVLELVGGPSAAAGLKTYIATTTDPFLNDLAKQKKAAIEKRIGSKPAGK